MNRKRNVLIFDDEDGTRKDWVERLREVQGFAEKFEVQAVETRHFKDAVQDLQARREASRNNSASATPVPLFDDAAMLIVDYDLLALKETGEDVAYLARCYSECGTIVGVNQFAREGFTFDLTLQGHPESYADLNLLADQLFNPGLWSTPWEGFRPWYWPLLPEAVDAFEQRVAEIAENLDTKIMDFLDVPAQVREIFPVGALEYISSEDATFRSFVNKSGKALRPKDNVSDAALARIAAARVSKWLERLVLPGQNILVDAAHLLERYPSLFKRSPEQLIGWPDVHELLAPEASAIDVAMIEQFRFRRSAWLSRTAWYWPLVSECAEISEVAKPWDPRHKVVFCEDTSRFTHPSADLPEFVARVDSPFVRRFVSTRDPKYGPQLQFAL